MKHTARIALLTFAISSLFVGSNVLAEPLDAGVLGKPKPVNEIPKKCERWEGEEKRLETLKSDLKLKPDQGNAWTEWAGMIKGDHAGWEEKHKKEKSWASLPVPDRMEKMLAFSKEHITRQELRIAATKTFYSTLTPEQRKIFDKDFNFEHQGHFGKGGKQYLGSHGKVSLNREVWSARLPEFPM